MADGDKDILQLHFGIDIRDVDTKVSQIKTALGGIVGEYDSIMRKLKVKTAKLFENTIVDGKEVQSPFNAYMAKFAELQRAAKSFNVSNSRISTTLGKKIEAETGDLNTIVDSLNKVHEMFNKVMNSGNYRGLADMRGAFTDVKSALDEFTLYVEGRTATSFKDISSQFEKASKKITDNWSSLVRALSDRDGGQMLANFGPAAFSKTLDEMQKFQTKKASGYWTSNKIDDFFGMNKAFAALTNLFERQFGDNSFATTIERGLDESIISGMDTAFGSMAIHLKNIGESAQSVPDNVKDRLAKLKDGLSPLIELLQSTDAGMNASSIVDLLNSAGSAVQIDGEQLAKNIEQKIQSVKVSINLKLNTNSITQADREAANADLAKHPLSIPVEFVFENGAKRVESAAKAASQAAEKSMSFSAELEELKAYREYLNGTAIDAETFRKKLDSVYENLFPRRNRPSLADNELLPQADKLIAEMEEKAAKLADASAKATARQQLMIGGDAIEAFRVDAQAKLDAMKPLEFTNIKLKASTVDASGITEAIGLDKLESNAKLLKGIAVPLSKLDVSNAKPVNADVLQRKFDALVSITIPLSKLEIRDDLQNVERDKLQSKIDALADKIILPIYNADTTKVKDVKGGEDVSKKISDLAHLVAYIQSIDLSKAQIENQEGLEAKVKEFANKLKQNFTRMGDELSREIKIPFLEQKNINRMFAYARAIKTIADSMKYLNKLQDMLAGLDADAKKAGQSLVTSLKRSIDVDMKYVADEPNSDKMLEKAHDVAKEQGAAVMKEAVALRSKSDGSVIALTLFGTKEEIEAQKAFLFNTFDEIQKKVQDTSRAARYGENVKAQMPMGVKKPSEYDAMTTSIETFNEALRKQLQIGDGLRAVYDSTLGEDFARGIESADGKAEAFTNSLSRLLAMGRGTHFSTQFDDAQKELDKLSSSFEESKKKYNLFLQAVKSGAFDIKGGGGMNIAGLDITALKRLQAEMKTTGDSFTEMMRTMGFYITGRSVITFFQNAIKSASQFSMEIRRIQSLATTFDFERIKTGLESLDARFGNLIHNAKALYWAFSSGVRGTEEELVRFTETMSKTAITIGSDVMPVMDAATTLMNAYGKSAASAGEISDLLFTIVKEGKANGQQLASSIGNIIAPASAMGLTFKDIGATISTLTRTMKTNNALTYLNNILSKMNNPTKEVQKQLDKLGLEINSTAIKAKGFAQVMREIHEATRGDINLIAKIFPDIRGQRAAVTLFSTQFGEFQRQLENFGSMEGNMQEALAKITDNPEAQFAALRNGFEMIRQAAGDAAINVITFGGALTPIFSAVNGMKSFGRSVAGHIAGLAALGVVMNMLGKAKLMLESANISSIQQMNLAYNEQTKAIADSVLSQRDSLALTADRRSKLMQAVHDEKLAANADYQGLVYREKMLEVEMKLQKARSEEIKSQIAISQARRDELKNAEELILLNKKNELAYQRFISAVDARKSTPEQWARNDILSEAGGLVREFKKETALAGYTTGLKSGALQKVIDATIAHELQKNGGEVEKLSIDAAAIAAKAGVDAKNQAQMQILNRMISEAYMDKLLSSIAVQFREEIKNGIPDKFSGSLQTKIQSLNENIYNRAQVAYSTIADMEKKLMDAGLSKAQVDIMMGVYREQNGILSEQSRIAAEKYRIELEVGGPAYKMQLDAQKALSQSLASESKLHEKNMMDIIRETDAQVKNAAAKRDAAAAEAAAMNGRKRLNDYIVQHNLQLGKEVQSLRALQKEYKALAAMMSQGTLTQENMARMQQISGMNLIAARLAQYGQFGGGSGALEGFRNAANAGRRGFLSGLSRASFLPIIGGPLGMITRPLSMMGDALKKATVYITLTTSALVKNTVAWMANKKAINAAILANRRLTMWQALASTSMSKFGGTMLNTALSFRGVVASAQALHMTFGGVVAGMTAIGITGGVVIGALALLTGKLLGLTEDGGPLAGFAQKIYGIDKALKQSGGYDKSLDLFSQQTARRKEYARRVEILQEETRYTIGAYDALGRMNGMEIGMLGEREKMLQRYSASLAMVGQNSPEVVQANRNRDSLAKSYRQINERIKAINKEILNQEMEEGIGSAAMRYKALDALSKRLKEVGKELDEAKSAANVAAMKAKDLEPGLVGMVEAYEMLDEINSNRMDIIASEATNTMRVAMLQKKINDTNKRIVVLLEGESEYAKMEHLAAATAAAYNAYKIEERKLAQLQKDKIKEDNDQYKEQEKAVERAEKVLQEAQTAQDNFRNSYVNYKKTQVQHLQEQIKLDREMAELSRKSEALRLDMDAMTGRGTFATAEKLALALSNSHKLMTDEMESIRARNNAFFQGNMKMAVKGGMSDFAKALRSLGAFNLPQFASSARAFAISLGGLFQNFAKWSANNRETNPEKLLPESRVLEIRKMQMDALKALTDFWQKVVTDMANIVKQSKNAIDDIQINRLREIMRGDRKLNPFDTRDTATFQRQRGELVALQKKQADLQRKYNAAVIDELHISARLENAQEDAANAMFAVSGAMVREKVAIGDAEDAVAKYNSAVLAEANAHAKYIKARKESVSETGVPSIMQKQVLMPITAELAEKAVTLAKKTGEASDAVEWATSRRRQAELDVIDAQQRYASAEGRLEKVTERGISEKSTAIKEEMKANADAIAAKRMEITRDSAMLRYRNMNRESALRKRMMDRTALEEKAAYAALKLRAEEYKVASENADFRLNVTSWYEQGKNDILDKTIEARRNWSESYSDMRNAFLLMVKTAMTSGVNPNFISDTEQEYAIARKAAVKAAEEYEKVADEYSLQKIWIRDALNAEVKAMERHSDAADNLTDASMRMAGAIIKGFNATLAYNTTIDVLNSTRAKELQAQARREWILRNGTYEQKGGVLKGVLNGAIIRDQKLISQMRGELAQGWYTDKEGNKVELDEAARAKRIAEINELAQGVRKNMDSYIDVQGDLVKRQQEARNGVLQLAQSLQKFRSVAADAVDSLSSEAFSMRFRSFSGLKELPQMRTTTREEQSMNENMERRDEYFTELNKFLAEYAAKNGQDAQNQYAEAIKGLAGVANTFKTAAETFDRAVQRPLTVNVNAVDVFGGRK